MSTHKHSNQTPEEKTQVEIKQSTNNQSILTTVITYLIVGVIVGFFRPGGFNGAMIGGVIGGIFGLSIKVFGGNKIGSLLDFISNSRSPMGVSFLGLIVWMAGYFTKNNSLTSISIFVILFGLLGVVLNLLFVLNKTSKLRKIIGFYEISMYGGLFLLVMFLYFSTDWKNKTFSFSFDNPILILAILGFFVFYSYQKMQNNDSFKEEYSIEYVDLLDEDKKSNS